MIIGVTGTSGSGKDSVAEYLKSKGFNYHSLSDILRTECEKQGLEITRDNLIATGNKLRQLYGYGILAEKIIQEIKNEEKSLVVSIRHPKEVEALKKEKDFVLIAVNAPLELRFERISKRKKGMEDDVDFLKFKEQDEKERSGSDNTQQINAVMSEANFLIVNDGTLEELYKKVDSIYGKTEKKIPRPTWDEYFMEITRAVAKRSTCDRGKVGCVIAKNKQILVSGYAGSPKGLPHCDEVGHQMKSIIHEDGTQTQHCVRTAHAEQNAICQAAKLGIAIEGATLYCRMTPCSTCAKMIINSGISRIVCEKKYHAGKESEEMFRMAEIPIIFINEEVEQYKNQ